MDLETQPPSDVTETISEHVPDNNNSLESSSSKLFDKTQASTKTTTTFSRMRQKRKTFGTTISSAEKLPDGSNGMLANANDDDEDPPLLLGTTKPKEPETQPDDDDGSGIFGTTPTAEDSVADSSVDPSPCQMTSDDENEQEEMETNRVPRSVLEVPRSVLEAPFDNIVQDENVSDAEMKWETQESSFAIKQNQLESKGHDNKNNDDDDNDTSVTSTDDNSVGDEESEQDEESKNFFSAHNSGNDNDAKQDDAEMQLEMESDTGTLPSQQEAEMDKPEPSEMPEKEPASVEEPTGVTKKKVPDRQSLTTSTDQLFLQVTDREKVTVKDILQSLQSEYECDKFDKESKAVVRERLTALILGQIEPLQESDPESSSSEEEEVSESEASGAEAGSDDSDFEGSRPRKKAASKKTTKKKGKASSERRNRIKRKSAAAVKAAAVRVQAEQLRKKRLEELRVRNEELQLLQSRQEQKRAAQIAAKLETDTEEMRLARLEKRLDLLQKLDEKRFAVIQQVPTIAKMEEKKEPVQSKDEESDEEESSEDEMELELFGKPTKPLNSFQPDAPISLLSWADRGVRAPFKHKTVKNASKVEPLDGCPDDFVSLLNKTKKNRASPGQSLNARAFLKKRLLSKQRKMGNQWLARELGYQNEKEHVEDCLKAENKKRLVTLQLEQERIQSNERKILRERLLKAEDEANLRDDDEDPDDEDYKEDEDEQSDRPLVDDDDDENEEMAMARELEQIESGTNDTKTDDTEKNQEEGGPPTNEDDSGHPMADTEGLVTEESNESTDSVSEVDGGLALQEASDVLESNESSTQILPASEGEKGTPLVASLSVEQEQVLTSTVDDSTPDVLQLETQPPLKTDEKEGEQEANANEAESEHEKPKGPRNSAWREMLKREAAKAKKLKRRNGEMIDDEADEEEEEEIVGLEDFGFAMHKKKKKDDDDNDVDDEVNEDDLENVVDDVSDGEGDEDAGEEARKAMEVREEKERHKEIMRRMREGYDGRRGGIAGGGAGARGVHRFDQLVAADNREDAKRLGLLNDDEMDSEDENEGKGDDDDEEEDEAALLDKMLKDRFLHRSSVDLEENFSEDEGEVEDNDGAGNGEKDEDLEEKEQERMAKRFNKRARMQRLIEAHGHEEEFSQMKLIEEDTTLKEELQKMKVRVLT